MGSKRVILSLVFMTFLIPLGAFNFHAAKGIPTPSVGTCPLSSAATICDFNYPDFTSTTGLILNGNAIQASGSILRLTPNFQNQAGSAWYNARENVTAGFTTIFHFQIHPAAGGDGFAFVIQNAGTAALGSNGGGIGYDGIPRSIAVEFDTYQNGAHLLDTNLGDISDHEIVVHTNDLNPNSADESYALPPGPIISPVAFQLDQLPHAVKIVYTLQVLEIFIDDFRSPVLAVSVNMKSRLGLLDGTAYVGFTASTGLQTENHDILDWFFLRQAPSSNIVQNGDFSNDLLGWTSVRSTVVRGARGEYPIFQTLTEMPVPSKCTPVGRRGTSFATMDSSFGASGYVEQQVTIPPSNSHLALTSWGWENGNPQLGISGLTNASIVIVDEAGVDHVLDSFTPPPMLNVIDPSNPAVSTCTGNSPVSKTYDLSAFAGQTVKLRLASQSNNCCGTLTAFADVDIEAPGIAVFQCPAFAGFKATLGSCALPNASPGQFYSYQLPVTGGVPPYDFTTVSGNPPPGLILERNGNIQGTTTSTGVFPLNLTIQDHGATSLLMVSITITVPPIVTGVSPGAGPVGGGTSLNVTGIGFSKISSVSFNGTTSGFHINSDTLIHVDSTPHSQIHCGFLNLGWCDAPGVDNVSVTANNYQNSFWCSAPDSVSTTVRYELHRGCNQFTYLPNADVQVCSSSAPGGLEPLLNIHDDNVRFHASYDASIAVADAELSGLVAFTSQAGYCLHLAGGQIKSFNFTTVSDYSVNLSTRVSLTAQYDNVNKPFVLAGPFQTVPILVGPIIIFPTVTPVLVVDATASAKMIGAISYNSETRSSLTFTPSNSKWNSTSGTICKADPITGQTATLTTLCIQSTSTAMTVLGEVKVALGLQFSLLLYDIAGPVVTPDFYLRLDGGFSTTSSSNGPSCAGFPEGTQSGSWGALCAGLEVGIGVQLNPLLNFLFPSTNWTPATFDLKSVLLAATITANPSDPNAIKQTDGTFKLNPGQATSITTTVAGSALPISLPSSSSWNPNWVGPTCGTLTQTAPGTFLYTAPYSGGVCQIEFTKSVLGLNLWTIAALTFRIGVAPSAPQSPKAVAQPGYILVQWATPSSDGGAPITAYRLYRGTTLGSESLIQTLAPALSFSDTSILCQTRYFYKVSAVNLLGEGSFSAEVVTTSACVASVPQSLTTSETASGILLSWQAPSSNGGFAVTGYVIYRGESPGQESFLVRVDSGTTTYTDTSVASGTTYYYRVAAINNAGTGVLSEVSSITPTHNRESYFPWTIFYVTLGGTIALLAFVITALISRRKPQPLQKK